MVTGKASSPTGVGSPAKKRVRVRSPERPASASRNHQTSLLFSFFDAEGLVDIEQVADTFRMSRGQIAETAGLAPSSVAKAGRQSGAKVQSRVTEMLEIISRINEWAGGEAQAMAWFRSQPIPALDGRTAEALVKQGRASAVREYLDHLALGGFA